MSKGRLIVIEGNDGSGKATQASLLVEALKKRGDLVQTIDFPRYYDNVCGKLVGECLRGEHGNFVQSSPKVASVLFAADRYESRKQILDWLDAGMWVVADRYTTANIIHQGGKIQDIAKRKEFIQWLQSLEYGVFALPKPDIVLYLDVPVQVSLDNLKTKQESYTQGKQDQHENNRVFLEQSRQTALDFVREDGAWSLVSCVAGGVMRSREDIHADIMSLLEQ